MRLLVALVPLLAALVAPQPVAGQAPRQPSEPWRIHLRVGAFDPLKEASPTLPKLPSRLVAADQAGLQLVQFGGPIQEEWHQAMLDAGLQVVTYVPEGAYLVWGNGAALARLATKAPLRWSGAFQPTYALHPDLAAMLGASESDKEAISEVEVIVQVFDHPLADRTVEQILKHATAVVRPPYELLSYRNLAVRLPAAALAEIAAYPDVVNIEPRPVMRKRDELQNQIMAGALNPSGTQPTGPGYLAWLLSRGFSTNPADYPIVDVTDDGIDNGAATPIHADFYLFGQITQTDRLVYNTNWTSDPSADGRGGHGTINASIVAGYNARAGFPYEDGAGYNYGLGVNPFGRVAGSKVFNNAGFWDLPGDNFTGLISRTYALGGRISTNSWGANTGGAYTSDDQAYDALVRDAQPGGGAFAGNQEITILFAAGNSGSGSNTTGSPGNAKNVITVGAAESVRPTWTDGCGIGPTGSDNAQDMASFSSRGPTDDQRVKPDLVAPGTHIQGAASQVSGYDGSGVCDQYMPTGQTLYAASSGTSHSTPAVAGAASLVHYWYRTHFGGQPPSPAMTKAWLINATRYLTGTGAGGNLPSNSQGYGETLLSRAFDDASRLVVDQSHLLGATGQVFQLQGQVADSSKPFRVTLAWTDAPGPTIGNSYVNNLDLAVVVGGQTYRGNVFSGAQSVTGGSPDPRNNVESVFLPAGLSGPFTVIVTATNIAGDGVPGNGDPTDQDFALLVYNAVQARGYLDGTVHDATLNVPLAGATVWPNSRPSLTTNAAGYFSATIPPGAYTVNAWKYGYTLQTQSPVQVITDAVTTLAFTLTQTALYTLTGQVTSAFTSAPLSATVQVYGPPGAWITQTSTVLPGGFYTLTLPGGIYTVTAQAPLHQPGTALVNLTGNQAQNFALSPLTTNGLLWGYVTSLVNGNPIAGAQVQVAPGLTGTLTDGDGYYELTLPPGAYVVTASASLYSPATATVVVPPSNLARQDFALGSASMTLTPAHGLSVTLHLGQQATQTLVISNAGTGALQVTLSEGQLSSSGSDAFGYTYADSLTGNAQYQWIDATDGTALALSDDAEANVTLPFAFTFYGISATSLRLGNNGAALFNATSGDVPFANEPLATTSINNLIAPFWDDLDDETGAVYYKTVGVAPNRRFVVQWHNRPRYNNIGAMTAQMVLYEGSNNLKFQYQDVFFGNASFDRGASATVGIRRNNANYLQYSHNQAVLTNSMAICFRYPGAPDCDPTDIPWLTLAPTSAAVAPGDAASVTFTFDASAVSAAGVYTGWVTLLNNDPANQPVRMYPVTMTVLPPPPALSGLSKAVSALRAGLPATYTLVVSNSGGPASQVRLTDTLPANTTFVTASHGASLQGDQVVWTGLSIPANGALSVTLTVLPACVPSGTLIVNNAYTVTASGWPTPLVGLPLTATLSEVSATAAFTYPAPALVQFPLAFVNQSQDATTYQWSFGDGVTSTIGAPTHAYTTTGAYTVILTAAHACDTDVFSQTVVVEDYAVAWQPVTASLSAMPGQTAVYSLGLTNTGTLSAAFALSLIGHSWPTTLSLSSVVLPPGQGQTVQVTVSVPSGAPSGSQSAGQVRAQALGDPRTPPASATARLTTTAQASYSVTLSIAPATRSGLVGQVLTYTAHYTNTSNVADTVTLMRANAGWPTVIVPAGQTIAPNGVGTSIISVTVPLTATPGQTDVALIQAQGSGAPAQAVLSARAIAPAAFMPIVRKH
ncbi:MAG: S8 family serine peptidase [Thermoflexales bacterium]|nr:S8 family serine peptidase [Thermoflexales bacterium]